MVHVIIRSTDKRVVSFNEMEEGISTRWFFDEGNDFEYQVVVLKDFEFDISRDLTDYRWDEDTNELVLDPEESEPIEYIDLSTGDKVTMTSDDFNALVDEKVRNNVEAVIQQMIDDGKFTIEVADGIVTTSG